MEAELICCRLRRRCIKRTSWVTTPGDRLTAQTNISRINHRQWAADGMGKAAPSFQGLRGCILQAAPSGRPSAVLQPGCVPTGGLVRGSAIFIKSEL